MEQKTRQDLKKIAEETEMRITRSILRWRYRKEQKPLPPAYQLENESRQIASRAHNIVVKRGKNVFDELKRVYKKRKVSGVR